MSLKIFHNCRQIVSRNSPTSDQFVTSFRDESWQILNPKLRNTFETSTFEYYDVIYRRIDAWSGLSPEGSLVVEVLKERLGHLKSSGRRLSPDDLQHHLPTVDTNCLQRAFQTFANQTATRLLRSEMKIFVLFSVFFVIRGHSNITWHSYVTYNGEGGVRKVP